MSDEAETHGEGREGFVCITSLDGLRGLDAPVVLWFHAGHLRGGHLGVDPFSARRWRWRGVEAESR